MLPGTVDDLLADARKLGHPVTGRLIVDWVALGLLDKPRRRSRGQHHGSSKALYTAHQRELFAVLIDQRAKTGGRVRMLTSIPIALWAYWGDEYVPLRQTRRALLTWLDGHRQPPKRIAEPAAEAVITQLAHPDASACDLELLRELLPDAIYKAKIAHADTLTAAVRTVFDPHEEGRVLGPPAVPIIPEALVRSAVIQEIATHAVLADRKCADQELDEIFVNAQQMLRADLREYLAHQPALAAQAGQLRSLFHVPKLDEIVNGVVPNLLLVLGAQLANEHQTEAPQ